VKEAVAAFDRTVALSETGWLAAAIEEAGRPARFLAALLGGFALLALALAVLGLYAVLSFAAARRTREVAIRIAIGARGGQVALAFLRRGMVLVGAGLGVGSLGAVMLSRGVATQLHGIELGAPVYVGCAAALALVGAAAAWIPARRASRHDPMTILRTP
jgi:ABC-type antimicrobial peptide transport system permease subunit